MQTLKDEILDIIAANAIVFDGEDGNTDAEAVEEILRAIQRHYPGLVFDPPLSPG